MGVASFLREKDVHQDYAVGQSGRSKYPGSEKHLNQGIFLRNSPAYILPSNQYSRSHRTRLYNPQKVRSAFALAGYVFQSAILRVWPLWNRSPSFPRTHHRISQCIHITLSQRITKEVPIFSNVRLYNLR